MKKILIKIYETSHGRSGGKIIEYVEYMVISSLLDNNKPINIPVHGRCY